MKIVFTVATYWPKTDGVQMVTQYQAEGLAARGHEVYVVTSALKDSSKKEEHNGVMINRVEAWNFYYWHRGNKKKYIDTVMSLCSDADALIAVCLQSFSADWLLNVLSDIQCKKILYLHGMPDFKLHLTDFRSIKNIAKTTFRNIRWKIFYTRNLAKIKKFDAITHLFMNDNSYNYFKQNGYQNNYILENACEEAFYLESESLIRNLPKKSYFLYVGNYCERKNQLLAMRAFYQLQSDNLAFVFIGSTNNSYYNMLVNKKQEFDQKYGERDVHILYNIPRDQIVNYTQNALACVFSSNYEYYPITIIEAMASGIPFISTSVGIVKYLPGGVLADDLTSLTYWMDFMACKKKYARDIGKIGQEYARENLRVENKVLELEKIIKE